MQAMDSEHKKGPLDWVALFMETLAGHRAVIVPLYIFPSRPWRNTGLFDPALALLSLCSALTHYQASKHKKRATRLGGPFFL
ncbi:hypothetical protein OQE62_18855, partial [Microbulbifer halophilus]